MYSAILVVLRVWSSGPLTSGPKKQRIVDLSILEVLRTYRCCKSIMFTLPSVTLKSKHNPLNHTPVDYDLGNKLLESLSKVQILEIHSGFGHQLTWPFLREALRFMRCLESVKFECGLFTVEEPDLFLPDAWTCVQGLKLQRLSFMVYVRRRTEVFGVSQRSLNNAAAAFPLVATVPHILRRRS